MPSIDDAVKNAEDKHKRKMDEVSKAFAEYEDFLRPENQNAIYHNEIYPAVTAFHTTLRKGLIDKLGGLSAKSAAAKEEDIQAVFTNALKKFFEMYNPTIIKATAGIKDPRKLFERLKTEYDHLHMVEETRGRGMVQNYTSIDGLIEALRNESSDLTVGEFIANLLDPQYTIHMQNMNVGLQRRKLAHTIGQYRGPELAQYLEPMLKERNVHVKSPADWVDRDPHHYANLHHHLKTGKGSVDHAEYGLKYDAPKK